MKMIDVDIQSVERVKNYITENVGRNINVKEFNRQGKVLKEYNGVIINTYENVFLVDVKINVYNIRKSFAYSEFLTRDLKYSIE